MGKVYLDYVLCFRNEALVMSVYDRSQQVIRSFCANLNTGRSGMRVRCRDIRVEVSPEYEVYIQQVQCGKEKVWHAFLVSKKITDTIILTTADNEGRDFYRLLMKKYDYPLLEWWGEKLLEKAQSEKSVDAGNTSTRIFYGEDARVANRTLCGIPLKEIKVHSLDCYNEDNLKTHIKELFQQKSIWISKKPQRPIPAMTMDEYFSQYGSTIAKNLEKHLEPLVPIDGTMKEMVFRSMRLYPQQSAVVNAGENLLRHKKALIQNEGMGTGKTPQSIAIAEKYFVHKWLAQDKKRTLADAYNSLDAIKYRNIVMCPGHLVKKWAKTIREQIPFSTAIELTDFKQLVELRNRGPKRTGKEFYVMSMDFGKLTYMQQPVPTKIKYNGVLHKKKCEGCGFEFIGKEKECPSCHSRELKKGSVCYTGRGLVCPECGELLFSKHDENGDVVVLDVWDFATPTVRNSKCTFCGTSLWQPFVRNIQTGIFINQVGTKSKKWVRATHYANKTHKARKSVWVLAGHEDDYFSRINEELLVKENLEGVRKYSPAMFIKKYMKGYFDIAILDELQKFKGGATGQGNAMDALVKASKKQLALTGTIAGGMADHLFYLMYRLYPARMVAAGYKWDDVMKFAEDYGSVERVFALSEEDNQMGAIVRGKQIGSVRAKPGISPRLFTDFLLDCSVFLDLSDMSKYLPDFVEKVISVELTEECKKMHYDYKGIIEQIDKDSKENKAFGLQGMKMQFALSYLDKPFGPTSIKNPNTGEVVCRIPQWKSLWEKGMLPKEKALIDLVKKEINENRCCVIFAEYTRSPDTCVAYRLKELVERHVKVKVAVLEASSPAPILREEWMHKKAEEGVKVFITNPKCTETGLDFIWEVNGTEYNFPTLMFYQLGSSLFTVWQASRRAYRLIQKAECRVFYFAYEGTVQMETVSLIAEKQVATSAIQGKFSTKGIASMATGVDAKLRIAAALSNNDFGKSESIQDMFDVLNKEKDISDDYQKYERMPVLSELIGEEREKLLNEEFLGEIDFFAYLYDAMDIDAFDEDDSTDIPEKISDGKNNSKQQTVDIFSLFA